MNYDFNFKEITYKILSSAVAKAIGEGALPGGVDYPQCRVEYPKEQKFGDTSSSFSLETARLLRKPPMEIGATLKEFIEKHNEIDKVEVVKPGFINIFFSIDYLIEMMKEVTIKDFSFGRCTKEKPRRVNLEFVSANPTGPLNIVSARAAAIGDTIASILEANGDIVEREFYVNDYGNQVELLGKSVLARIREIRGEDSHFPEDGYHGAYVRDIAAHVLENFSEDLGSRMLEKELNDFSSEMAIRFNVERQKQDLEKFNVKYNCWFKESSLHQSGDVSATLKELESKNVIYSDEGKKLFRSTDYGDDKDRVVMRDDGRPTYLLADIAYHRDKIRRGYDLIIDIWGPDHHGYIKRLEGAVKALEYHGEFFVLIAQQVNLVLEGDTIKMSKRLGNFSTMSELIEEIGVDVARYFFIMRSLESHLDFDLALAKKESSENPVFYLQYAYARICSIFREAEKRGIHRDYKDIENEHLKGHESVALIKMILKYPEEIASAAETLEPHKIANYLLRLAQVFHRFYTEHRVLTDDAIKTNSYLFLSDSVRIVLRNGLRLLGISTPEKM